MVRVRDGRAGRDPHLVGADGYGELLATFESDVPLNIGQSVTLPDGSRWPIIGVHHDIGPAGWTQDVSIGTA